MKTKSLLIMPVVVGLIIAGCSSSTFSGSAGKASGGAPSSAGAATNAGSSGSSANADAAANGGAGNTNAGASPCSKNAANAAVTPPSKSLLFYAPADYSSGGGPEGTTNTYLNEVQSSLTAGGYKITLVNAVTQSAVNLDPCTLYQTYDQIWLWLPCNSDQNMDDGSFAAVKSFYDYGGALALLTDNHYYTLGEANTHCDGSNWAGSTATPSDAVRFGQYLGVTFSYGSLGGLLPGTSAKGAALSTAAQALATAWSGLNWNTYWNMITIATMPANGVVLPVTSVLSNVSNILSGALSTLLSSSGVALPNGGNLATGATYAALIETPATATTLAKTAFVFTPVYAFHFPAGQDADTGFKALADYFEAKVEARSRSEASGTASLALTGAGGPVFDAANYLPSSTVTPSYELQYELNSPNKEHVVAAIHGLASQGLLTADDLMPFMEHPEYIVRLSANIAAQAVPRADMLRRLTAALGTPRSAAMNISVARSLAAIGGVEALPNLRQALPLEHDRLAASELSLAIADLEKIDPR